MYRGQKLNAKGEKRLKSFLYKLEESKKAHKEHKERWDHYRKVYHGEGDLPKDIKDLVRSKVLIPWAWQQLETIIPRVMDPEPRILFHPVERNDDQLADALNLLTKVQLRQDHFVLRQRPMVEDGCVDALNVMKVIWHQKRKTVKERKNVTVFNEETGQVETQTVFEPRNIIVENRPHIAHVDNDDFFWDPAATSDQDWRWVFHRIWLTKAEMLEREKAGVWKDVKKACADEDESGTRSPVEGTEEAQARRKGRYAVYEGWFNDGTRMSVCGGVVLEDRENPYAHMEIPFVAWSSQPNPRSLVGISEVEKIEALQEAIWIKDNQRIDAVNFALNNIMIMDPTIPGVDNIKVGPQTTIHANFGQRVEQLPFDSKNAPAFQESEAYLGAMMSMTGAGPMLVNDPSVATQMPDNATGFSIMQEESHVRMAVKKLQFRLAVSRVAKMMVQLNHQFLSQLELNRILGEAGMNMPQMTPTEIPMFVDVMPEAMNESIGKMTERNASIELLNIVGTLHGTPMNDGTIFDVKPIVSNAMKTYDIDPRIAFQPPNPMMMGPPMGAPPMGGPPTQPPPEIDQQVNTMSEIQ